VPKTTDPGAIAAVARQRAETSGRRARRSSNTLRTHYLSDERARYKSDVCHTTVLMIDSGMRLAN
jgi:hypothetical protein